MVAAELTEYFYGQPSQHDVVTGSACKVFVYSGRKETKADWIILGDFTNVRGAYINLFNDVGTLTSQTVYYESFKKSTATANALFLTSDYTGPFSMLVWGE